MIKFFRNIRKTNLKEGKKINYLKYAIGEIVLVVIGILIALQINNWNENRKLHSEELNSLSEIKSNLEITLKNFKNDTLKNSFSILQYRKIEDYIQEDLPYNTKLDRAFAELGYWSSPYPILTAYTTLKTKGLDIISNTSLRNNIIYMYEFELTLLSNDYDKAEWQLSQSVTPFILKYMRSKNSKQSARPNDFESLKHMDEFSNILGRLIAQREHGLRLYKTTMVDIEHLIEQIDKELNSRK